MFRDTFAIEMLLAGARPEQVAILLGHKSVKITTADKGAVRLTRSRNPAPTKSVE